MYDVTNRSLPVSREPSFVVTTEAVGIFSTETRLIFDYAALAVGPGLAIFGMGGNIVNIIIFYRLGLDNTINISFFTLAIADLFSLLTLTEGSMFLVPPIINSDFSMSFHTLIYHGSGWPHMLSAHITSWIIVYVTAERCLCIALPLKVKEIITPRVTSFIIGVIFIVNIVPAVPDLMYTYLDWKFNTKLNRTILTLSFREKFNCLDGLSMILMSILGLLPFPTVIVFTVILVVKLQQQTTWRQKSSHDSQKAQMNSKREMKTMSIVALIATILIVCYIPDVAVGITMYIEPTFTIDGTYKNMYLMVWYLVYLMHLINSSVNIFLYYNMSSKFKESFHQLFDYCICVPRHIDEAD